jgi:hypothetical protein
LFYKENKEDNIMDECAQTKESTPKPTASITAKNHHSDQAVDIMRRFYLTDTPSAAESKRYELQLGLLSYSDNLVDWYYQSILLQHFNYAMILTEGSRIPDTTLADNAGDVNDVLRAIPHPLAQAPAQLADKFITLLKQQETRTDIALALAYANLQVTRLEFSIVTRHVAKQVASDHRENKQDQAQASAIAKALVNRLEAGLLLYSNPYAHMPAMEMKHANLQKIYPGLPEKSITRIASVIPYILFLMNDHSIEPGLVDSIMSTLSGLLDPAGRKIAQQLSGDSIVIKPATRNGDLELYLRATAGKDKLPLLSDYTWELRDEDIDLSRLPSRIESWNSDRAMLAHSLKLSTSQVERVLAFWLTNRLAEAYTATRALPPCFSLQKGDSETPYIESFFKQTVFNYLLKPSGIRETNDLLINTMNHNQGKQSLGHRLDTMAAGFIKQLRELTRNSKLHPSSITYDPRKLEEPVEINGHEIVLICWDKTAPLTHANHFEIQNIVDLCLDESQQKDNELNQTSDLRLARVASSGLRLFAPKEDYNCKQKSASTARRSKAESYKKTSSHSRASTSFFEPPTHTSPTRSPSDETTNLRGSRKSPNSYMRSSLMTATASSTSRNRSAMNHSTTSNSNTDSKRTTSRSKRAYT